MTTYTDLVHKIDSAADLESIELITNNLIGQVCWNARLGYGDELIVEIGEQIPYLHKSGLLAGKFYGAWRFGSRGTRWEIILPDGTAIAPESTPDQIQAALKVLNDTHITRFTLDHSRLDLTIRFDNDRRLLILPHPDDDEYADVPYWELFTPGNMLLSVGPGPIWSYRRAE